jgi:hypothetical protein
MVNRNPDDLKWEKERDGHQTDNDAPTDAPMKLESNIEWYPARRTLVADLTKIRKHPWQYWWKDAVLAPLPLRGDYRIICHSDAGAWVVDAATFWARADIGPKGTILADPQLWEKLR